MKNQEQIKRTWDNIYEYLFPNYGEAANFLTKDTLLFTIKDQHEKSVILHILRAHNIDVQNKNVLDLGCGTGRLSFFFQRLGATVVGVDISSKYIGQAISLGSSYGSNVIFIQSDVKEYLAKTTTKFDIVVMSGICYLYPEEELKVLITLLFNVISVTSFIIVKDHIATKKLKVDKIYEVPSYFRSKKFWFELSESVDMNINFYPCDLYLYSILGKRKQYLTYLRFLCKANFLLFPFDYLLNKVRSYIIVLYKGNSKHAGRYLG